MTNLTISVSGNLSSSASANTTTAPGGLTAVEFWVTHIFFMGLAYGCIGTIGNTAIAIGIIRSKKLRTRFYVIICYLAVDRIIIGLQSLVAVAYRTLRALNYVDSKTTRALCYLVQVNVFYMNSLEMVFLLTLVVDRTMAVVAYKHYRRLTYQQANAGCAVITLVTVTVKLVPSWLGVNFGDIIPCVNSISPLSPLYTYFTVFADVVVGTAILVVYIYLIIYVRFRFMALVAKGTGQEDQDGTVAALNQHTKLMPLLTRLVWLHVGLTLASKTLVSTQQWFPPQIALRIATYAAAFTATDVVANTAVLLFTSNDLKQACLPCCIKPQPVALVPSSTTQPPQRNTAAWRRAKVVPVKGS